jgi:hypothetical protein
MLNYEAAIATAEILTFLMSAAPSGPDVAAATACAPQ